MFFWRKTWQEMLLQLRTSENKWQLFIIVCNCVLKVINRSRAIIIWDITAANLWLQLLGAASIQHQWHMSRSVFLETDIFMHCNYTITPQINFLQSHSQTGNVLKALKTLLQGNYNKQNKSTSSVLIKSLEICHRISLKTTWNVGIGIKSNEALHYLIPRRTLWPDLLPKLLL
jgi:hypothetical protein